jgi:DNA-binding HxlR family transcriptional regulator
MKRYGQVCAVARALDVLGDRWSLLVLRELMLGPRRYSDLQDGLPGIGTNVLATRLKELVEAGVVTRRDLPPPAPATVYELTDAGRAVQPVLRELRLWGLEHGPRSQRDDAVRPAWVLTSAGTAPAAPVPPGATAELTVGDEVFTLTGVGPGFSVRTGPAVEAPADVHVAIDADRFLALAVGAKERARPGWRVTAGDAAVARRFFTAIAGTAANAAPRGRG